MRTEPSADEAREVQLAFGEVVAFQVAPPFGETYTGPGKAAAASLAPSTEEATDNQLKVGALLDIHVCAWRGIEVWIKTSQSATGTIPGFRRKAKISRLIGMLTRYSSSKIAQHES